MAPPQRTQDRCVLGTPAYGAHMSQPFSSVSTLGYIVSSPSGLGLEHILTHLRDIFWPTKRCEEFVNREKLIFADAAKLLLLGHVRGAEVAFRGRRLFRLANTSEREPAQARARWGPPFVPGGTGTN